MVEAYKQYAIVESGLDAISGTVLATKVHIKKIIANNASGDHRYFQIFDTGSLPTVDNVPRKSYPVPATGTLQIEFSSPVEFVTGAVYSWSNSYSVLGTGSFSGLDVDIEFQRG